MDCTVDKSDNLQHNAMLQWVNGTIVPQSDGPIFQQFLQNSSQDYFN